MAYGSVNVPGSDPHKQDKLTGKPGQIVGFNKDGSAVAQAAPETGVTSFKGRTGAVIPTAGDYTADQVGAAAKNHTHTAAQMGAAPADHSHSAADVGAAAANHTHTPEQAGAAPANHTHNAADVTGILPIAKGGTGNDAGYIRTGRRSDTAVGENATIEGSYNACSGENAHSEGRNTSASGVNAHAEGCGTVASGFAAHAEGFSTNASNWASHAMGRCNKPMTGVADDGSSVTGDVLVIGNGTYEDNRSNCFRVTYTGAVYALSAFNSTGADYAEFFEWSDGNPDAEDRVGYFVTLDGKHIRKAGAGDYILGVVSGQPCIIGNADEDWLGRWEHDEFGRFAKEYLEIEKTEIPINGLNEEEIDALRMEPDVKEQDGKLYRVTAKVVDHKAPRWRYKANPNYDPAQDYVERKDRPEWSVVGMLGVLSVRDDGTCRANGFCRVAEGGTATSADTELAVEDGKIVKGYRVLERVSNRVIKIVFRG